MSGRPRDLGEMIVRAGWACDWGKFDREGLMRRPRRRRWLNGAESGPGRIGVPGAEGSPAVRLWIQGIISSKRRGITVANAFMTDGRVVRFGIVARDPLTVRTLSSEARPGDVEAIEAWFAAQGRER